MAASEKPIIEPPRRITAVSKLNLVRVDGSKNKDAMIRFSKRFWEGCFSKVSAKSRMESCSFFVKSVMDTKFLFFINLMKG